MRTGHRVIDVGCGPGALTSELVRDVESTALVVTVVHASFEEWWGPFTLGVGPAGAYTSLLNADRRAKLMKRCSELLPPGPFEVAARAWTARGLV